jgi:multicomponent Na+:H+ antiporter subunit G
MELIAATMILAGAFFFLGGTLGLLRFPDTYSRIHALTKADNLGLGFIVAGAIVLHADVLLGIQLAIVWILALVSSSTACYLIAHSLYTHTSENRKDG